MSEINEYNQRIQIDTCWDCKKKKRKKTTATKNKNERKLNEMKWNTVYSYMKLKVHISLVLHATFACKNYVKIVSIQYA